MEAGYIATQEKITFRTLGSCVIANTTPIEA